MSEERLFKFRRPEWLNSVYARNAGVYSSGALVSFPSPPPDHLYPENEAPLPPSPSRSR